MSAPSPDPPRPIIGLSAYAEQARWGAWDQQVALVPWRYVGAVDAAGGRPVALPPLPDAVTETLDVLDGLLVVGGPDIEPAIYGAQPHPETAGTRPERDAAELSLLRGAEERNLPVLGVCRGMELMNVARGGSLIQHLPHAGAGSIHRDRPGEYVTHPVSVAAGTRLAAFLGERTEVPSYHHQAPQRLGSGLLPTAWAADGMVEGLEDPGLPFWIGVLWHPEAGRDPSLFRALVSAAARYREERG